MAVQKKLMSDKMNLKLLKKIPTSDIEDIKKVLTELSDLEFGFADAYILWKQFSDDYSTSWLVVNDETLEDFREWLLED